MPNLQSALGVFAILALAFAISENRRAVPWRPVVTGLGVTFALALADAQSAADRDRVRLDQSRGRCGRERDQGRHQLRVRLCRRRRAAVRRQDAGGAIHPRLPGAAGGAGDERVVVAAVLLAHHAADRARFFLGAGKDARRRRRRRALHGGQYFRRPGRGAAVHPALSGAAHAQRNVHRHDRRHGRHRRHGVRALCDDPVGLRSRTPPAISRSARCSARRRRS